MSETRPTFAEILAKMPPKKPANQTKSTNGSWANRLRATSPASSGEETQTSSADHSSSAMPVTMDYIEEALHAQIKEALCSDEVVAKLKEVIEAAIVEKVSQNVYQAVSLDCARLREQQKQLTEKMNNMGKQIKALEKSMEEQEQYSRRECLRFYGIPEEHNEDTDALIVKTVKERLNVTVQPRDIARSHRITPRTTPEQTREPASPKPIIVKFSSYNIRQSVFHAKSLFKGSPIYVQEDLTTERRKLLKAALEKTSVKRVWTRDGRITALVKVHGSQDRRVAIRNANDIERLD